MAKARKTTPIQVSRVIAPCFLARAARPLPSRPLPSRPLLRDAVLLEEVLLLGRELLDELRILLVRHRSEEHTSELQSLMRISYAVFCLKQKHNNHIQYQLN